MLSYNFSPRVRVEARWCTTRTIPNLYIHSPCGRRMFSYFGDLLIRAIKHDFTTFSCPSCNFLPLPLIYEHTFCWSLPYLDPSYSVLVVMASSDRATQMPSTTPVNVLYCLPHKSSSFILLSMPTPSITLPSAIITCCKPFLEACSTQITRLI